MGRFRGKGSNSLSNVCCLAGSLLVICEGMLRKPASPTTVRKYTYSELRNDFGFTDNQILDYFSKPDPAGSTAQESFGSVGGSGYPSTVFAPSSLSVTSPDDSISPSVSVSPEVGKTYTYTDLRFSDQHVLDYHSKQNPATRISQQDVSIASGMGTSSVMPAPPVDRTYTYSELRNELGFSDEQILDYYMKHDPTTHMQQSSSSFSNAGNFSVMPAPLPPSRTYTYSEMHDELGLSDEQILNYYSNHDLAKRDDLEEVRSPSDYVSASVSSPPQSVASTYSYGELRNNLGFSDEQILDYYLKHDPANRMVEQGAGYSSSVENVRGMSAHALDNRIYSYSELRNELGFSDEQILDYYRRQAPASRAVQQGSGLVDGSAAKHSALSPNAIANATANSSASSALVGRAHTYSELRDEFGLSDDQILEYYSEVEHSKHPTLPTAGIQNATTNSIKSHTRARRTYTYSELRDVLGFSDAQIANYYSNTDEAKQVSRDIESSGIGSASAVSSATPSVSRSYTYAELRDDLGFTDNQILEYYMKLDPATSIGLNDSAAASARPLVDRAYTYSELRDELGLSDKQILEYYSRSGAKFSAATNVNSPDVTANSSAPTLVGKAYTYSELRDEFDFRDDQIIAYYKHLDANRSAGGLGNNGTGSELLNGRKNDYDGIRGQRRAGKSYTYSELRDVLGWSDEQIMSYYASGEKADHDASQAGNTASPLENLGSSHPPSGRLYTYSELRNVLGFNDQQILDYFAQRDRQTQLTPSDSGYLDGSFASSSVGGNAETEPASKA
eukprot:TRINITY_DN16481_c0_g2_i1.p1 TRINITY_DN16481_c0_g2~~TRINITY_DN16481_c0_g2_i1.p1  ORF type:complete len:788 (+),score=113.51 TRINITY_DN16481_c0_g2_i1:127-2490(+)